jgi:ubiquinone/menaquinone biosynthesis C-methylase UbiE
MSSKDEPEIQSWRSWWERRGEQSYDSHELIRGAPDLLSEDTKTFLNDKLTDLLELQLNDVLVDAGCGVGDSIILLAPKCKKIIGIDYAKTLLDIAIKRCTGEEVEYKFICASIDNIPLKDRSIDKCICLSVLHYIPEERLIEVISEIRRITKDNGIVVIWCKNSFTLMTLYEKGMIYFSHLYRMLFKPKQPINKTENSPTTHYRFYRNYRKLFEENLGVVEEEWSFALFSWRMLKIFNLNRIMENFERSMRQFIPFLLRPFGIEYYFKIRVKN